MKKIISRLNTSAFPEKIKPMLPTLIKTPFDSPEFIYEIKWDGFRAVTYVRNSEINIYSRKGFSFNQKFPAILNCFKDMKTNYVFDGEIIITDEKGRADFESLRHYSPGYKNLCYYIFDILYYDKYNLMNIPLTDRKNILKKVLPEKTSLNYVDHIENYGVDFFKLAEENQLEGIIAKKKNSIYLPGIRTMEWLKIKTISHKDYLDKYPREF
jgi:bifunctional non-homologous end joining protein LigD